MRVSAIILSLVSCFCLVTSGIAQCIDTYQPGCKLPAEIGIPQRHCIDPTKYWLCTAANTDAELRKCPGNMGFDQDMNTCIPWIVWVWKPCREPPSRPTGWQQC